MTMDLAIFHQCYNERQATEFAISEFKKYNPDYKYYLVSDGGEDYADIASKYGAEWNHECNTTMNGLTGRVVLKIVDRLIKYFTISNAKYLMLMEDDIWCRGHINFDFEFDAIGANSTGNLYPENIVYYVNQKYNIDISNKFYNLCGGSIINRNIFFDNYENIKKFLIEDQDLLIQIGTTNYCNLNYVYGSLDSTLNMLYLISGKDSIINPEITETWRDKDWRTNNKKIVHWYKTNYKNGTQYTRYYL